mgnify:CR=1 FL=1
MSSIIKIKNLTFSYSAEEERKTLDNVNLEIEAGQWVALIGHNGSGKSTLARCIDGLLMPESGSIEVDGLHLTEETVWDVRERIGMVFQNPDNQFVGADVEGDVAFGMENRGIPRAEMQKRVKEVLEAVDMTAFSNQEGRSSAWRLPAFWPSDRRSLFLTNRQACWIRKEKETSSD